ncbi:hypothetical protein EBA15_18100 [Xanthomonas oryzae pv. oryzae]|nr:hypothetical protein EBA15_18100 [Xanthomonas oryzae pv. oryzae]
MICSSEKRFFTSNLLGVGNWTTNQGATQNRGTSGLLPAPPYTTQPGIPSSPEHNVAAPPPSRRGSLHEDTGALQYRDDRREKGQRDMS